MTRQEQLRRRTVQEGCKDYCDARQNEWAYSTERNNRSRLKKFVKFADHHGIEHLSELSRDDIFEPESDGPEDLHDFMKNEGLAKSTRNNHLCTIRCFINWCEKHRYCRMGLSGLVEPPTLRDGEGVRDKYISEDRGREILNYLGRYEPATLSHTLYNLLWRTGMRLGDAHSLDLSDWNSDERFVNIEHRPETGTTLKNGSGGDRVVKVYNDDLAETLDEYIDHKKIDKKDEYGREPLFSSHHGRMAKSSLQAKIYGVTSCRYIGDCGDDDCQSRNIEHACKCELSVSPHVLKHSAVTYQLNREGVTKKILSERVNTSEDVLERYDNRVEVKKMEKREDKLSGLRDD